MKHQRLIMNNHPIALEDIYNNTTGGIGSRN